jgi:two-component system response regulator HydG
MRNVRELVTRIAAAPVPVLVLGETGTGKSLVAQAIHAESARATGPLVVVNCAALPESLLVSELFGYLKGSFTGATSDRPGLFREANGGTLFLDEIGEMAPALQAKLLRVIEQGTVRPVGATKEEQVDVRIVVATHRDLQAAVKTGSFRADLLYRLDVISIHMPALRDRREDIPELVSHFLKRARAKYPNAVPEKLSREALDCLLAYDWPGNLRELDHVLEKMVLLGRSATITPDDVPETIRHPERKTPSDFQGDVIPIRELQRRYATWALAQLGGHKGKTAEKLGIDAKTLWKWLNDVGDDSA